MGKIGPNGPILVDFWPLKGAKNGAIFRPKKGEKLGKNRAKRDFYANFAQSAKFGKFARGAGEFDQIGTVSGLAKGQTRGFLRLSAQKGANFSR